MIVMVELTTVQMKKGTREMLKTLRITKRESYDEIINRVVKEWQELKKNNIVVQGD